MRKENDELENQFVESDINAQYGDKLQLVWEPKYQDREHTNRWSFLLYIRTDDPFSVRAFITLYYLCREYLPDGYRLRIVDVVKDHDRAVLDGITSVPTLVKRSPGPEVRLMEGLDNRKRVAQALGLVPQ